jgi:NAD(P)-dependent dehydrogenase (short-subunit alcohol dehydrogenase family)
VAEASAGGMVTDQVVLVTGGSGGIGRAAARLYAREGAAHVVIADLKDDDGAETVRMVEAGGAGASYRHVDLTDEAQVEALVAGIVADHGRLDVAFNNAGITDAMVAFTDLSLEAWNRMIGVNLTSVFLCMKHELRQMAAQGAGAIVNTSSGAGVVGFPGLPHYVAAKHGVLGLTRTGAAEFGRQGVRVNAVLPGSTATPMLLGFIGDDDNLRRMMEASSPTGKLLEPEDIAEAAVWLSGVHARLVNGQAMIVDGGGIPTR